MRRTGISGKVKHSLQAGTDHAMTGESVRDIRDRVRNGALSGHTAGLCPGLLQTNVVIVPKVYADPFRAYCLKNPMACPLIDVGDTGDPLLARLGADIDIRTDVPRYNVYQNGRLADSPKNISDYWTDDLVAFALGCSFTFERALMASGVPMRHIEERKTVPMFRTGIETVPENMFSARLVVSMRPIPKRQVDIVVEICGNYPFAHGPPFHLGHPGEIGIGNLDQPDWGNPLEVHDDEITAFWACGVTTQVALETARLPIAITHRPGAMLITDIPEQEARLIA